MEYKNEEEIRKDFARLFGWTGNDYNMNEPKKTSWAEIFCEVGRLLEAKRRLSLKEDVYITGGNPIEIEDVKQKLYVNN